MAIPEELLEDLEYRRETAVRDGGVARAVLDDLFADGAFQEIGRFADHAAADPYMAETSLPGDGVVSGVGYLDGRPLAAFAQNLSVGSGSMGRVHADKICTILDHASKAGTPVVGFYASLGGRLEEGMEALAGYGQILNRLTHMSGVVPQIAVVMGPCPGTGALLPSMADFIIMVRGRAGLYLSGPEVIEAVTGIAPSADETGGADVHAEQSGLAHFVVDTTEEAVVVARKLLSFLPSNNMTAMANVGDGTLDGSRDPSMDTFAPATLDEPFDVRPIIHRLVDDGDFLEVQERYAPTLVVGLGRIGGMLTGVVASQPMVRAGVLDVAACDKAARFVRFCDAFGIAVVTLVDAPGFMPGADQEHAGLVRYAARLAYCYAEASCPKITVVMRKAFGGAFLAMGSRDLGADMVFAWPTADVGLSGGDADRDVRARYPSPYLTDGRATVADVIEPAQTRARVALALRGLASKREMRVPRKHGTLPP